MQKALVVICVLLLLMSFKGYADMSIESLSMLSEYYVPPNVDGMYHFDGVFFEAWDYTTAPDGVIRSVAIDDNGNVGIIASTSSNDSYPSIICVFSKTGSFLYGYQFKIDDRRGSDFVFFNDRSELCYYLTYNTPNKICERGIFVFDQYGSGIQTYYVLPSIDELMDAGIYITNMNNHKPRIYISPASPFRISQLEDAKLVVRNAKTEEEITIYDQTDEYAKHKKATNKRNLYCIIGLAFMFIVIFLIVEGLERIKDQNSHNKR